MRWLLLSLLLPAACGSDGVEPLFAENYRASFVEVRNCRASADHDLNKIRVLADPTAMPAYTTRANPFPVGSILLKEEYDFADGTCAGEIVQFTVMKKLDASSGETWQWQRVSADRGVESENESRCIGCHAQCGVAPDGHDGTCAVP